MTHRAPHDPESFEPDPRRVVVVGPCASGKSTLVRALKELGYDARVSGQEHSEIAQLWRRSRPDVLIALTVDIATVLARRGQTWPPWLLELQLARLQSAIAAADLSIDSSRNTVDEMVTMAETYLKNRPTA